MSILSDVKEKVATFDRQVWALFGAAIISVLGTSMVMTFLSIYMYEKMGIPMTQVGLAFFISSIAGAVASYIGGSLCDRFGRKKILVGGLILEIIGYLLISYAIDASIPYFLFLSVMTFNSFAGSLVRPVPDVMIADVVEPSRRVEAYGLLRIGSNLGWVLGPVAGGLLLVSMPYSSMFYITALTTSLYLLIAIFVLRDTRVHGDTPATGGKESQRIGDLTMIIRDTPFLLFCLISGLMLIPYQQMYTLFSVYSSAYVGLDKFWIGILFAESGIMVALSQYYISSKVKRFRITSALAFSTVTFACGFGALAFSTALFMPFACMAVITFAEMIWIPSTSTLQANMSPEDMRGRYFGFAGLLGSIGYAIGPLFGGVLKDSLNDNVPSMWIVVALIFLVCGACFWLLSRYIPERMNAPAKSTADQDKIGRGPRSIPEG